MDIENLKRNKRDIENASKYTKIGKILWFTSIVSIILLLIGFALFFNALNTPTSTSPWSPKPPPTNIWADDYLDQLTPKKNLDSSKYISSTLFLTLGTIGIVIYRIGNLITTILVIATYGRIDRKYVKGIGTVGPILLMVGFAIWFLVPFGLFSISSELEKSLTAIDNDISKLESTDTLKTTE